jgi:hypothetical protein
MPGFISYRNYCATLADAAFTSVGTYYGAAKNLRDARLSRGLSVVSNGATWDARIDLGAVQNIGLVGLFGIKQQPGTIEAFVKLSSDNTHSADIFSQAAHLQYEPNKTGKLIWRINTSRNGFFAARYVSISIASCLAGRGAGMLWVGNRMDLAFDKNFAMNVDDSTVEFVTEGKETELRKFAPGRLLDAVFPSIQASEAYSNTVDALSWENLKWHLGSKGFAVISPRAGTGPDSAELRTFGALYVAQPSTLKHESGPRFSASLTAREEVGSP